MPYCQNCGKSVSGNAKFCIDCGVTLNLTEDNATRKQEFVGKISKCPSCGAGIPSFTAMCPVCGHEINSARVTSSIKDFAEKMIQCDLEIANSPVKLKKGWSSWGKWGKIGWVFLNISTFGGPVIIPYIFKSFGVGGIPTLTAAEMKKLTMIDNFAFPNDRESILEALLFIKSQVSSLSSGKVDRSTQRWIGIWKNKADQLFQKADIMFKGDKIAIDAYDVIVEIEKKVKKSLGKKRIIGIVLIIIFVIIILSYYATREPSV